MAGSDVLSLTTSYNELMIEVEGSTSAGYSYTFSISKQMLSNTGKRFFNGFYHKAGENGTQSYGVVKLHVSLTTVKLAEFFSNYTNITSGCTTHVYYR